MESIIIRFINLLQQLSIVCVEYSNKRDSISTLLVLTEIPCCNRTVVLPDEISIRCYCHTFHLPILVVLVVRCARTYAITSNRHIGRFSPDSFF